MRVRVFNLEDTRFYIFDGLVYMADQQVRKTDYERFLLPLILVLIFVSTSYFLLKYGVSAKRDNIPDDLISSILVFFSVVVMFAWFIGAGPGVLLSSIAAVMVLITTSILRLRAFELELVVILLVAVTSYSLRERIRRQLHAKRENTAQIHEQVNILRKSYQNKQKTSDALIARKEKYLVLRTVAQLFGSTLGFDQILQLIVNKTMEVVGKGQYCLLFLTDEGGKRLALKATRKAEGISRSIRIKGKRGDDFDRWVVNQRQVLLIENAEQDFRFVLRDKKLRKERARSLISAPLIQGKEIMGLLRVESAEPRIFQTDDLRLLDILARLAAASLQNAILYRKTEELAVKDSLTGLYVHRYLVERLPEELKRVTRSGSPLSFIMMDIDNFKGFNDKYGHTIGDNVLIMVGRVIENKVGEGNIVARYGGEEFAVILPRVAKREALKLAEAIRHDITSKKIPAKGKYAPLSISAGVVTFPDDAVFQNELIKEADAALMEAKRRGKNRVCCTESK